MIGEQRMPDIILVSGGFDPVHSGHIKLINNANKYGDVVVLLNSDAWLRNKKGKEFLTFDERKKKYISKTNRQSKKCFIKIMKKQKNLI